MVLATPQIEDGGHLDAEQDPGFDGPGQGIEPADAHGVDLGDEIEEEVVDDADGGEENQDPGKRAGRPTPRDRVTRWTGLRHDAAQPRARDKELDEPRSRHAAEDAGITTLGKAEPEVPHFVSLENARGDGVDERARREDSEPEASRWPARGDHVAYGHPDREDDHHRAVTFAWRTDALRLPGLIVVERAQVEKGEPPGGKEEYLRGEEEPGADRDQAPIEQQLGLGGCLVGSGSNRHRSLPLCCQDRPPAARWEGRNRRDPRRSRAHGRNCARAPGLAPATRETAHARGWRERAAPRRTRSRSSWRRTAPSSRTRNRRKS